MIWPNGLRYPWTDAFGVVLLVSLYRHWASRASSTRRSGWSPKSTGCSAGRAASASGKRRTATVNISTILRCGSTRSPCWRTMSISTQGDRSRAPDPPRICHSRPRRGLEDEGRSERAVSRLWLRRARCLRRLCVLSMLDENALAREIADMRALIDATAASLTITQDLGLGMMLWLTHFFPARMGCGATAALPRRSIACGAKTAISAASPISPTQIRIHQLRRFGRSAGCRSDDRTGATAERLFRSLPVRRRVRPRGHHPRDGVQLAFSRLFNPWIPYLKQDLAMVAGDKKRSRRRAPYAKSPVSCMN